jgi:hypothetical protein
LHEEIESEEKSEEGQLHLLSLTREGSSSSSMKNGVNGDEKRDSLLTVRRSLFREFCLLFRKNRKKGHELQEVLHVRHKRFLQVYGVCYENVSDFEDSVVVQHHSASDHDDVLEERKASRQ